MDDEVYVENDKYVPSGMLRLGFGHDNIDITPKTARRLAHKLLYLADEAED